MPARIAVNIGNTRIACGFFVDGELQRVSHFLHAQAESGCSELAQSATRADIKDVALGSVVPAMREKVSDAFKQAGLRVHNITPDSQQLVRGAYQTLGADRLANAAAAYSLYARQKPALVLDFGTATTLTAVDQQGNFLGGLITLGLGKTFEALNKSTAQLPDLQKAFTQRKAMALSRNTEDAITGGCLLGHVGQVEYWIKTAVEALGEDAAVIATGGYCGHIQPHTNAIEYYDPDLTIRGINAIAEHTENNR